MSLSKVSIKILIESLGEAEGELRRILAPITFESIISSLPLEGRLSVWKEEVYFETPIKVGAEKPKKTVKKGDIAYWPLGSAICIFFGKSQPYSPVNLIGKVTKNLELFEKAKNGMKIRIERI